MKKLLIGTMLTISSLASANCLVKIKYDLTSFVPTNNGGYEYTESRVRSRFHNQIQEILTEKGYDIATASEYFQASYVVELKGRTVLDEDGAPNGNTQKLDQFNSTTVKLKKDSEVEFEVSKKQKAKYGVFKSMDVAMSTSLGSLAIAQYDRNDLYQMLKNDLAGMPSCQQ